jgi:hypothetical protein
MKLGFRRDFAVQVRHQERDEEEEWGALFYRGIFSLTLNQLISILFIPNFPRTPQTWPPTILEGVDKVQSETEARLYITESADYVVTPDAFLAGQQEVIPLPPIPPLGAIAGTLARRVVVFYVTPQQFARFSRELALIEEQTYWVTQFVRVHNIAHLECIKFIQNCIISSPYFSHNHDGIIGRQSEARHRREQPVPYRLNGTTAPLSSPTRVAILA